MIKRVAGYNIIALLIILAGCTKENMDDCSASLRLKFTFTLHTNDGNNLFGPDVQIVKVYFFDENGILSHIQHGQGGILTNDYEMDVQIAPGKYTIIAWGGSNEDFANSFHEGHMNDPQTHDYENGVTIGKTSLNDFRIFLNYGIADNYPEDIIPVIDGFDDLYYGAVGKRQSGTSNYILEQVEVKTGVASEKLIELIRDTNILKVTVTGLEYLPHYSQPLSNMNHGVDIISGSGALQVWASARNGRYKYDNSIGEYSRIMRYNPFYRTIDDNSMIVDIKTMRLDILKHRAEPVYIYIQDTFTGETFPKDPIDVVNTLLQAKDPATGEYIYNSQEDFDKIYEHPIDIQISADLHVRVFVHGWEIIVLHPEVIK